MTRLGRALAVAVALASSQATAQEPPAHHEPSAGDLATARAALKEGLALREKGDVKGAVGRLATAYDLVPTPVTGFELGKAQMMAGKILEAHELFKKVVHMPPSMEESDRSKTAREESARLANELAPRIPSLRIHVKLPPNATAELRVDDDAIPVTGGETLRAVDPGSHEIVAKAGDGPEQRMRIDVAESEIKDVEVSPQWIPPKVTVTNEKGRLVVVRQGTSTLTLIGFAGASAGLALTASAGYVFITSSSDLADKCGARYCPQTLQDDYHTRTTWGIVTLVGGLATVGFLAAGIIGVTNPPKERVVVGVRPVFGPGGGGIEGRF